MRIHSRLWTLVGILACSAVVPISSWANSKVLNVQGTLTDTNGNPLTGTQTVTFRFYTSSTASVASAIWTESDNITFASSGTFNVALGSTTALDSIAFNQLYYLGIQVAGDANELSPRQALGASAYAQGSLGSFNVGNNLIVAAGSVGIGTASPGTTLDVNGAGTVRGTFTVAGGSSSTFTGGVGVQSNLSATSLRAGTGPGGKILEASETVAGDVVSEIVNNHSTNGYGLRVQSGSGSSGNYILRLTNYNATSVRDEFIDNGNVYLAEGGGNVGIGTTSPGSKLDVNGNINAASFSVPGGGAAMLTTSTDTVSGAKTFQSTVTFNGAVTGTIFPSSYTLVPLNLTTTSSVFGVAQATVTLTLSQTSALNVTFAGNCQNNAAARGCGWSILVDGAFATGLSPTTGVTFGSTDVNAYVEDNISATYRIPSVSAGTHSIAFTFSGGANGGTSYLCLSHDSIQSVCQFGAAAAF